MRGAIYRGVLHTPENKFIAKLCRGRTPGRPEGIVEIAIAVNSGQSLEFPSYKFQFAYNFLFKKARNYRKSINLKILTSIKISDFLGIFSYLSSFLFCSIVFIASFKVTLTLFIADSRFASMLSA